MKENEYGSLEGTLIQLVNDPLKNDGSLKLRERTRGNDITCHAEPRKASELAHYLNREIRVVLYGTITFEDGIPTRMHVEDFSTIPPDGLLPTLDDLRAMRLRIPGVTAEEYLDDVRGDG